MHFKNLFVFVISCFILFSKSFSQKSTPELFLDFDIDSLKGKDRLGDLQNLDSFQKYLELKYDKNGYPAKMILLEKSSKEKRKGRLFKKNYGTVIGFNILKTTGYEKVLIFGEKDYYSDSILIKKDTVIGRQANNDNLIVTLCWKKSEDTIILKRMIQSYRYSKYYPAAYFIALKNYKQYFTTSLFNSVRTLQIIRNGINYRVEILDPGGKEPSDYDKKTYTSYGAKWGHSLFWLVVEEQVFLD